MGINENFETFPLLIIAFHWKYYIKNINSMNILLYNLHRILINKVTIEILYIHTIRNSNEILYALLIIFVNRSN